MKRFISEDLHDELNLCGYSLPKEELFAKITYDHILDWLLETHKIIIHAFPVIDKTANPERVIFIPSLQILGIDEDLYEEPEEWNLDLVLDRYEALQLAIKEAIRLIKK